MPLSIMLGIGLANAGGPAAFTPVAVQGVSAGWDASRASTVTLNSGDVAAISDVTGNSRAASQGTGGEQPAYTTAALNGLNGITFTGGNNDSLSLANALGLMRNKPGNTALGVAKIPTLGSIQRILTVLTSAGGGSLFALQFNASNVLNLTTRRVQADAASGLSSAATISANTPFFFAASVDYATGAVFLQIDATTRSQTAAWATGAASEDLNHVAAPTIGRNLTATLTGDLYEMYTFGRALSAPEIADLRTKYFKPKWGLS